MTLDTNQSVTLFVCAWCGDFLCFYDFWDLFLSIRYFLLFILFWRNLTPHFPSELWIWNKKDWTEAKHCSLIIFSIKHNRSDISWRSVLFVEVTEISGENSRQKSLTFFYSPMLNRVHFTMDGKVNLTTIRLTISTYFWLSMSFD